MQCPRCASVVADTVTFCPKCGNPLAPAVDSYGATSFAPVVPAAQPTQISAKNATAPMQDAALASTLMAGSSPVPPTMLSGPGQTPRPSPRAAATPSPRYVVTPAPQAPPPPLTPSPYAPPPTMQSAPMLPSAPLSPYAPPPGALGYPPSYPMVMPPMMQPFPQQTTPGLAVASLVCGLLGWIPFWIGFILCLLAITFGGIVLAQTRPGQPGRGLAITGLVFGLVLLLPAACGL